MSACVPRLEIVEQPQKRFRFRYESELGGTHGQLTGRGGVDRRSYPTVKLEGFTDAAVISCQLYTGSDEQGGTDPPIQHVHFLQGRGCTQGPDGAAHINVDRSCGHTAVFQGLGIIHTARRQMLDRLVERRVSEMNLQRDKPAASGTAATSHISHNADADMHAVRDWATRQARRIDMNCVRLRFTAHGTDNNALCHPIYSDAIYNLKSVKTGQLRILQLSEAFSPCTGNKEIWLLVERVKKSDIRVRVYEENASGEDVWSDYGRVIKCHHQYAIIFQTPQYRDRDLQGSARVFIQLERPSDGCVSEPKHFQYTERHHRATKRLAACEDFQNKRMDLQSGLGDFEIPPGEEIKNALKTLMQSGYKGLDDQDWTMDQAHQSPILSNQPCIYNSPNQGMSSVSSSLIPATICGQLQRSSSEATRSPHQFGSKTEVTAVSHGIDDVLNQIPSTVPQLVRANDDAASIDSFEQLQALLDSMPLGSFSDNISGTASDIPVPSLITPGGNQSFMIGAQSDSCPAPSPPSTNQSLVQCFRQMDLEIREKEAEKTSESVKLLRCQTGNVCTHTATGDPRVRLETSKSLVGMKNINGHSPMHVSVPCKRPDALAVLLAAISELQIPDSENIINGANFHGRTGLHLAALCCSADSAELLLRAGAHCHLADAEGNTAVHLSAARHGGAAVLDCLLQRSSQPQLDLINHQGYTAMHLASLTGSTAQLRQLRRHGADVNCRDNTEGRSPLYLAVLRCQTGSVKTLLSMRSVDIDGASFAGVTPLQVACRLRYYRLAALLVAAGADTLRRSGELQAESSDDDCDTYGEVREQEQAETEDESSEETEDESSEETEDKSSEETSMMNAFDYAHDDLKMEAILHGEVTLDDLPEDQKEERDVTSAQLETEGLTSDSSSRPIEALAAVSVGEYDNLQFAAMESGSKIPRNATSARGTYPSSPSQREKERAAGLARRRVCELLGADPAIWRNVAELLELDVATVQRQPSPTNYILRCVQKYHHLSVQTLAHVLDSLGAGEATRLIISECALEG